MWKYLIHSLARAFLPIRIPDPDYAGISPRYCYSVWMRHLVMAWHHGLGSIPNVVVELGPGASQGVGLAALLSGAGTYKSVDVVDYRFAEQNGRILESMIELFENRADIPGPDEFPFQLPNLAGYKFPSEILSDRLLAKTLEPNRLDAIRAACRDPGNEHRGISLRHHVISDPTDELPNDFADLVLTQGVLLYVPDIENEYRCMSAWLKPGGFMSHQNDYRVFPSFPDTKHWNSHWGCSDLMWSIITRKQLFTINRQPHSAHLELMRKYGLKVVFESKTRREGIAREKLAKRFRDLSEEDLHTSSAFILAVKRPRAESA
ncbi:MAG: hypothetical protein IT426_04395 [Pirellulales bacterium]|nr:hypothetical protein [Pirellulales bacterium]